MLRLKSRENDEKWSDTSEIWAPRLGERSRHDVDPKSALIRALTFACEQVYEQAQSTVTTQSLDRSLRRAKWLVFTRLRYHLYAQYPAKSRQWIQEEILHYPDYGVREYLSSSSGWLKLRVVSLGKNSYQRQS